MLHRFIVLLMLILLAGCGTAAPEVSTTPEPTPAEEAAEPFAPLLPCAEYQPLPKKVQAADLEVPVLEDTASAMKAKVVRVTDGDTLVLDVDGQEMKVRLLGIDTPEKYTTRTGEAQHYGEEASRYAESLIEQSDGEVYFSYSEVADREDRYGRQLGHVWVKDGKQYVLMNAIMVRDGYAYVYTVGKKSEYTDLYRGLMKEAMENNRGLWGVCD